MADVFISYARADREFVRRLSNLLEERSLSVWWDRELVGGVEFSAEIERELEIAGSVLVVWSEESVSSRWVRDEASAAADAEKLVALSLDGTPPPIGFRQLHAIDFDETDDNAIGDLLRSISRNIDRDIQSLPDAPQSSGQAQRPSYFKFAAIILVVALAITVGSWILRPSQDATSANELALSLQQIDREKSVAVRPFETISGDSENAWFATALTGEITSALGRIPDVIVAQQGDVAALTGIASAELARELGVANVLEGTILQTDEKLRVSVRLADAEGRQIWAETYDRPATDLIEIHEEIAAKVAEVLGSLLDPEKLTEFVNLGTKSFEAYQYMAQVPDRAFTDWDKYNLALDGYRKAYTADPSFARAHLRAAVLHLETISPGPMDSWSDKSDAITERWPAFLEELKRGRELARLEDDIAYGRFMHAMGFGNIGAMRAALTDQLTANPTRTGAIWSLVHVNNMVGKSEENGPLVEAFLQLAPDRIASATHLAWESGMKEKALELAEKILLESASEASLHEAFDAFVYMGELDRAEAVLSKHNAMTSDPDHAARTSAYLSCARGNREPLLGIVEKTDDRGQLYVLHMMLGNTEEANALLQKYDRARPPYPLMWQAWSGAIDVTQFPNLRNLIERDGLEPTKMRLVAYCPA